MTKPSKTPRTWHDFESTGRSLDGLCGDSVNNNRLWHRKKKVLPGDNPNKTKHQLGHFLKRVPSDHGENTPAREVALMEFFRLMVPRQPKTRYVQGADSRTGTVAEFVRSKEVLRSTQGFSFYDTDGTYIGENLKGKVELDFFSLNVLCDTDHEARNHLTDNHGWLYRVDGGHMGLFPETFSTPSRENLDECAKAPDSEALSQALLKFLTCTDSLFDTWAGAYDANTFHIKNDARALKRLRHQHLITAMHWPYFKQYLKTTQAQAAYQAHKDHVSSFCVTGKNKLVQHQRVLDHMDIRFQFLKNLAKKSSYQIHEFLDETSLVAQLDYLHGRVSKIREGLAPWKQTYPAMYGRTNRLTPLNALMGSMIYQLDHSTETFLHELTVTINKLPQSAAPLLLKEEYTRYKKTIENVLDKPEYAELKKDNSVCYSFYCGIIFVLRTFFRFFDMLINGIHSTKNDDPNYMPFFYYPQKSLHQEVKKLAEELDDAFTSLDIPLYII